MSFPEELKSLRAIAHRATELDLVEPAVAYWSRYYIVQKTVLQKNRSKEVDAYLAGVLDLLETMRLKHASVQAIQDEKVGKETVTAFALKVFDNADREAKAFKATATTARTFLAAAGFLEVCSCFGQVDKEVADRRKYAKVQAMRIQAALAAGRDPNARPKGVEVDIGAGDDGDAAPTAAEQAELDALLQGVKMNSGNASLNTADAGEEALPSPIAPNLQASGPSNPYFPTVEDEAEDRPPQFLPDAPSAPVPRAASPAAIIPMTTPPVEILAPFKSVPVASVPPAIPKMLVEQADIDAAQKHAKFAISALNYDDIETAISELRKGLARLGA